MKSLDELKNMPIVIDDWMVDRVGKDNGGLYKEEYPKIAVNDIGGPLVSLADYGVVSSDFYLNEYLSGKKILRRGSF